MRIQESSRQGCVVLTLAGRLDLPAAPQLQRAILKRLAQQPPAIICDLGQVEAIDPLCAGVFTSIHHPALGWLGQYSSIGPATGWRGSRPGQRTPELQGVIRLP